MRPRSQAGQLKKAFRARGVGSLKHDRAPDSRGKPNTRRKAGMESIGGAKFHIAEHSPQQLTAPGRWVITMTH